MTAFEKQYYHFLRQEIEKDSSIKQKIFTEFNILKTIPNYPVTNLLKNKNIHDFMNLEDLIENEIIVFYKLLLNGNSWHTKGWLKEKIQIFLSDENHYKDFLTQYDKIGFHHSYDYRKNFLEELETFSIVPHEKEIDFLKNHKVSNEKLNVKQIEQFLMRINLLLKSLPQDEKFSFMERILNNYGKDFKKPTVINELDKILHSFFKTQEIKEFYTLLNIDYVEDVFESYDSNLVLNILLDQAKFSNKLQLEITQASNILNNIDAHFNDKEIKNQLNIDLFKIQELKGKKYLSIIILKKDEKWDDIFYKNVLKDLIVYYKENNMVKYRMKMDNNCRNWITKNIEKNKLAFLLPEKEEKKVKFKI